MRCIFVALVLLAFCSLTESTCRRRTHLGECPVNLFRCAIACLPESAQEMCQNSPSCCTKDSQCPDHQKCCQPPCGCFQICRNATYSGASTVGKA